MNSSTKAVLAAAAGAILLVGGYGSLAFWQDSEAAPDATITSGTLDLSAPVCTAWRAGSADVDLATYRVVPGDVLTRSCTFTADVAGRVRTAVTFVPPALDTSTLAGELTFGATYARNAGAAAPLDGYDNADPAVTDLLDGDRLRVDYRVTLPFGSAVDNDSNSAPEFTTAATGKGAAGELTAVLDALTVTVTQVA